jgi:Protein of unknown function (DUF2845)
VLRSASTKAVPLYPLHAPLVQPAPNTHARRLAIGRRVRIATAATSLFVGALFATTAWAEGLQCGRNVVSQGDSLMTVRSACGIPDFTDRRLEVRTERRHVDGPCFKEGGQLRCGRTEEHSVEITIDEWVYDFGPRRFIETLTFEQGKLIRVVSGPYGKKEAPQE